MGLTFKTVGDKGMMVLRSMSGANGVQSRFLAENPKVVLCIVILTFYC